MTISYVKDLMMTEPQFVAPTASLQEAAKFMASVNCGMLPVGTPKKVKGIITDRDIVTRAVSAGRDPAKARVEDYMTEEVFACNENDTLTNAAEKMREHKVSRLLVRNHAGQVVGVLSFGGLLRQSAAAGDIAHVVERATSRLVA